MENYDNSDVFKKRVRANPSGIVKLSDIRYERDTREVQIEDNVLDYPIEQVVERVNQEPKKFEQLLAFVGYKIDERKVDPCFFPFDQCIRDIETTVNVTYENERVVGFGFPTSGYEMLTDKRSLSTGTFTSFGVCGQSTISNVLIGVRSVVVMDECIIFNVCFISSVRSYFWDSTSIVEIESTDVSSFERDGNVLYDTNNFYNDGCIFDVGESKYIIKHVKWYDPTVKLESVSQGEGVMLDINGCNYYSPRRLDVVLCSSGDECLDSGGIAYSYDCSNQGRCVFSYDRDLDEFRFVSSTNKNVSSTQYIDLVKRKVIDSGRLNLFFFFPGIGGNVQVDPIPFKFGAMPLINWRQGERLLWFPCSDDKKGDSRNSYVSRHMASSMYYDRATINMRLTLDIRNFRGNNSYGGIQQEKKLYGKSNRNWEYCSVKLYDHFLPLWCKKRTGDLSYMSNVFDGDRYLIYFSKCLTKNRK